MCDFGRGSDSTPTDDYPSMPMVSIGRGDGEYQSHVRRFVPKQQHNAFVVTIGTAVGRQKPLRRVQPCTAHQIAAAQVPLGESPHPLIPFGTLHGLTSGSGAIRPELRSTSRMSRSSMSASVYAVV